MPAQFPNLSVEAALRVDARCGFFETKLLTGQKPRIEDCLGGFGEPERSVLLRELLLMELEYRLANVNSPDRASCFEYYERFPNEASLVADVLNQFFPPQDPVPTETAALPQVPPRYEILAKLGEGGMGAVYKAIQLSLKREVAIKVIREKGLEDEDARLRFKQEMEVVGQLKHPNIVEAYDADYCEGICYLAMEFVDGLDLAEIMHRLGPLRVADACELVRRAAMGLQQAHRCQLIHRDIKPSNLLLGRTSKHDEAVELKIADLGLARLGGAGMLQSRDDLGGSIVGTPEYMAPEQYFTPDDVDIRADIYSLGCTLHTLLLGKPPFSDRVFKSYAEKMKAHLYDPLPPIREARPDVSKMLEDVVHAMMAKRPEERYETPEELVDALTLFDRAYDLLDLLEMAQDLSVPADSRTGAPIAATQECAESTSREPQRNQEAAAEPAPPGPAPIPTRRPLPFGKAVAGILVLVTLVAAVVFGGRYFFGDDSEGQTSGDLLALVDSTQHSIRGGWRFEESELISPDEARALLQLPSSPPEEYTLQIACRCEKGRPPVIGLVWDGKQIPVILASHAVLPADATSTRRDDIASNELGFRGGAPDTYTCIVRQQGFLVAYEDEVLLAHTIKGGSIDVDTSWLPPASDALFLGANNSIIRISAIRLIPIAAESE